MRILKVHNYYTGAGGEDSVFHAECTLLRSQGLEVIEYLEHNSRIASMNQALVAVQTLWSWQSYKKLYRFLREHRPDIVHFHNTFPLISPSAYYACKELGLPVVQTLDNQRLMCPASTFYRNEKLCLACLDKPFAVDGVFYGCYHNSRLHTAVVASMVTLHRLLRTWRDMVDIYCCSTKFYRTLFIRAGFPEHKLVLMPHFIFDLGVSGKKDGKYGLFVGRLDPEKGVKTLLKAWQQLDVDLKVRGNGRLDNWAKSYVQDNGMHQVEFVKRLNDNELSDLVGNARVLIMPSEGYYETFGMVIIEAFSRGVPVIASDIGVATELIKDGHNGLLFEAGNSIDLADKVRWLWNHPEDAAQIVLNGRAIYMERYSPEKCYNTLIGVYEKLLKNSYDHTKY